MARKRHRRGRDSDKSLLDGVYRATVVFALAIAFHGERHPTSQRARKRWNEALRSAGAAGISEPKVKERVRRGGQEAEKITALLDKFPNMVLILELSGDSPGWKILGGGEV